MNVRKIFIIILMLFASSVFAQTTHMGVPAKDMVVLTAYCSNFHPNPPCGTDPDSKASIGTTYRRILPDGSIEPSFTIPLRKVLVITDYEWRYKESTVLEDSAKSPVMVNIGYPAILASSATTSQSELKVIQDDVFTQSGHASGELEMTSGFVVGVLPQWSLSRNILETPPISNRYFFIVIRGYLLDVP